MFKKLWGKVVTYLVLKYISSPKHGQNGVFVLPFLQQADQTYSGGLQRQQDSDHSKIVQNIIQMGSAQPGPLV